MARPKETHSLQGAVTDLENHHTTAALTAEAPTHINPSSRTRSSRGS